MIGMKDKSCCSICCYGYLIYLVFWIVSAVCILAPANYSVGRHFKEVHFYTVGTLLGWRSMFDDSWDDNPGYSAGLRNVIGHGECPENEPWPTYLTYTKENFTSLADIARETNMEVPFLIKGLFPEVEVMDYDFLLENFADAPYTFERGAAKVKKDNPEDEARFKVQHEEMTLHPALWDMKYNRSEPLYLRFSGNIVADNDVLADALEKGIDRFGKDYDRLVGPYKNSRKFCFVGYGNEAKTLSHNAVHDNYFIQISGAKRWRLVAPGMIPYMKPLFGRTAAFTTGYTYVQDDSCVPHVDVISAAGDFLYFPSLWWHEVHHADDIFQFGCGIRPFDNIRRVFMNIAFPLTSMPGDAWGGYSMLFPRLLDVASDVLINGVMNREKFYTKKRGTGDHDPEGKNDL